MPRQSNLFDTTPPQWELDDADDRLIAEVALTDQPWGPYDYLVPDKLRDSIEPGKRVKVPLGRGNRSVIGYCLATKNKPDTSRKLKPISAVIDARRLLSADMIVLAKWISAEYHAPLGTCLGTLIPAGVRVQAGTRETTLLSVPTEVAARLSTLKLPEKQAEVLRKLALSSKPLTPPQLAHLAECTQSPIQALRKKGLIVSDIRRLQSKEIEEAPAERESRWTLNAAQQEALDTIVGAMNRREHRTLLLHGVTGSGKTEVYIQAIEEAIRYGRQAIVLVPEISLTPQTKQRFRARFDNVAVLHSHMSDVERHQHWRQIASGEVQVVVGARSAVFAPIPQLGLIVIDEEHDNSFKQDSAPRYHARAVALWRARRAQVPLILGSATPALESWGKAKSGEYELIDMPGRVADRPLPHVGTIDLRDEFKNRFTRGAISRQLHRAVYQAIDAGGQVILLLNRRGYSTHIQCPACGHVVKCTECDIALTHHREEEKAVCHFCDYTIATPPQCPECGFGGIRFSGFGTQKLEAEVNARFKGVKVLRMDSDTMKKPGSHEVAFARFRQGEVKILLGTQMIAKGLDFPNVTLVGVINADTALHLPDFRAGERTFQLVTQVAGRTGRGEKGGRVLVQTFSPEHYAIDAAVRHDFHQFAAAELPHREEFGYPPYSHLARLIVRGPVEAPAAEFIASLTGRMDELADVRGVEVVIRGPTPAPIARLRGLFRFHALLTAEERDGLHGVLRTALGEAVAPDDVQWALDVDPLDML